LGCPVKWLVQSLGSGTRLLRKGEPRTSAFPINEQVIF
jgi:hypothetical protein